MFEIFKKGSIKSQNKRDGKARKRAIVQKDEDNRKAVAIFFKEFGFALEQDKTDEFLLGQAYSHSDLRCIYDGFGSSNGCTMNWFLRDFDKIHKNFQDVSKKLTASSKYDFFLINDNFLRDISAFFGERHILKKQIVYVEDILKDEYKMFNWHGSKLECVTWYLDFLKQLYKQGNEILDIIFSLQNEVDKLNKFKASYNQEKISAEDLLQNIKNLNVQISKNADYTEGLIKGQLNNLKEIDQYINSFSEVS